MTKLKIQTWRIDPQGTVVPAPAPSLKGVYRMNGKAIEIKHGNVVYQVEREFIGTVSREELLKSKLKEDTTSSLSEIEIDLMSIKCI